MSAGTMPDSPGVARGEGESWAEAARRLRGDRRLLHPLALEVMGDVQ